MPRKTIVELPRPDSIPAGQFHHNAKPLVGKRFGKLEVIEERGRSGRRGITYLCLCDCGKSVVRLATTLLLGRSTSCGCNSHTPDSVKRRSLKLVKEDTAFRQEHRHYTSGAKQRNIQFALNVEEFTRLLLGDCAYCGSKPSRVLESASGHQSVLVNGIDRLDNAYGYLPVNSVSCCGICNFMKRTMGRDEFLEQCRKVVRYSGKKS